MSTSTSRSTTSSRGASFLENCSGGFDDCSHGGGGGGVRRSTMLSRYTMSSFISSTFSFSSCILQSTSNISDEGYDMSSKAPPPRSSLVSSLRVASTLSSKGAALITLTLRIFISLCLPARFLFFLFKLHRLTQVRSLNLVNIYNLMVHPFDLFPFTSLSTHSNYLLPFSSADDLEDSGDSMSETSNRRAALLGAVIRDHGGSASSSLLQETPHVDSQALPPLLLLHHLQVSTRGLHHLIALPLTLLQWLHLLEFLAFLMVPLQPFKKPHPFLAPKSRQLQLVPQPVHLSKF